MVFLLFAFGISCVTAIVSSIYDKVYRHMEEESIHQPQTKEEADAKYAVETIGENSVYQFFLGNSILGSSISLGTVAVQAWMLFIFIQGAEIDLSDDVSDLVYIWMCPRDHDECRDLGDLTWSGWAAFIVLMIAHLLKDVIDGAKMIVLSGKAKNVIQMRIRFFLEGTLLSATSIFTFRASLIYNTAIATSNTEIIVNSVVILFVCDVDELFHDILMTINPNWAERSSLQASREPVTEDGRHEEDEATNLRETRHRETNLYGEKPTLEAKVEKLDGEVQALKESFEIVLSQNSELKQFLVSKDTHPRKLC